MRIIAVSGQKIPIINAMYFSCYRYYMRIAFIFSVRKKKRTISKIPLEIPSINVTSSLVVISADNCVTVKFMIFNGLVGTRNNVGILRRIS